MPKREAEMPFFRILTNAFQYAFNMGHPHVTPFEMLVALLNDPEAAEFFKSSSLDYDALKSSLDEYQLDFYELLIQENLEKMNIPEGQRIMPVFHPQSVIVASEAKKKAVANGRSGFAELLESLVRTGDEHVFETITNAEVRISDIAEFVQNQGSIAPSFNGSSADELELLKNLEAHLKDRVFDQDKAIEVLAQAIKRSKAGLKEPDKPVGSFLFTGPTGTGKTELAKQTAEALGYEFLRFDMSEYMEKHNVSRLIGAPPGYIGYDKGGELTGKVAENGKCVILLDEIEKAHPSVFNALLQIMDAGRMTDGQGNTVDFSNVILIMTSNAGAHRVKHEPFGFAQAASNAAESQDKLDKANYEDAIRHLFTPEFRNRLDAVITFDRLSQDTIRLIADKMLRDINEHMLAPQGVELHTTPSALDKLAEIGFDDEMGARPMKRAINEIIKNYLADAMLFGDLKDGGSVVIDCHKETGEFEFEIIPNDNQPDQGPDTADPAASVENKPVPALPPGPGNDNGPVPKVA